jgi:predicted nucleotidyltransferase component of viral defense system
MKKRTLSPTLSLQWAQAAHAQYLNALMSVADWSAQQFAFHGGTSLHLSWNSARYSEDLDFLLSREVVNVDKVLAKVLAILREQFRAMDAQFVIDIQDKSKDPARMLSFQITVSHAAYMGNAMVKAEFWRTDAAYLANYPTQFRTPIAPDGLVVRVMHPVPVATLETAYADKLTAFATRPYVKWRDVYDLWWIGTQSSAQVNVRNAAEQFLHNIQAYTPVDGLTPANALRKFLANDRQSIIAKANPDLKRWLPASLWNSLHPDGIVQMVDYVYYALQAVADTVDNPVAANTSKVDLRRVPPMQSAPPKPAP